MGTPIYSVVLYDNTVGASVVTLDPPAGHTWVVRDMTAYQPLGNTGHGATGFSIYSVFANTLIWGILAPVAVSNQTYHWEGRAVFTHGNGLHLYGGTETWRFRICGYDFSS